MKTVQKLLAIPVLSLSAMAYAAEPAGNEIVLSASQMDGVTAGTWSQFSNWQYQGNQTNQTQAGNVNISPAVGVQVFTVNSSQTVTGGSISQSNYTFQYMRR